MVSSDDVLYGLSRKWWEFYIHYTKLTPPESPREMTLVPKYSNTNMNHEWDIQFNEGNRDEADYVMLDREQWMDFCKWYNGGPVINPKSARGLYFQYDVQRIIRFIDGYCDDTCLKRRFHLREGGGIRSKEILKRFDEAEKGGESIPMKVLTKGIWPDDMANALPNVCGFAYEESIDHVKRRKRRRKQVPAEAEHSGAADLPAQRDINVEGADLAGRNEMGLVGIRNLGSTCYMNASFHFLLRPLSQGHYDRVRGVVEQAPVPLLREFFEVWKLLLSNNSQNGGDGTIAPIELTDSLVPTLRREWAVYQGHKNGVFNQTREEDTQEFLQFIFDRVLDSSCKEMCEETFRIIDCHIFKCIRCSNSSTANQESSQSANQENSQSGNQENSQSGNQENSASAIHEDPTWMLRLPFKNEQNNTQPMHFTLEELLNRSEGDRVDGQNCSRCGSDHIVAYTKLSYASEFFIMFLGRAIRDENRVNREENRVNQNADRLNHSVTVPLELDLEKFIVNADRIDGKTKYKLYGVIDHLPVPKHFTATVAQDTGKENDPLNWFEFNDDFVKPVKEFSVNPLTVYMLMYKRVASTNNKSSDGATVSAVSA